MDGVGGARAAFWTVYTAVGGEPVLGRPVSRRFLQGDRLFQVFERGVITADRAGTATATARVEAGEALRLMQLVPASAREPEPVPVVL